MKFKLCLLLGLFGHHYSQSSAVPSDWMERSWFNKVFRVRASVLEDVLNADVGKMSALVLFGNISDDERQYYTFRLNRILVAGDRHFNRPSVGPNPDVKYRAIIEMLTPKERLGGVKLPLNPPPPKQAKVDCFC